MNNSSNMFNSYDATISGNFNTINTYPQQCINEKLDPCRPNKPYEEYDAEGNLIGYYWYYGDTTILEYNIEGEVTAVDDTLYETAENFMKGKSVSIMFYDFRNTLIFEKDYSKEEVASNPTKIILEINEEDSKNIFVRGVYYCSFVIWDGEGLRKTLFSQTDATFTVK